MNAAASSTLGQGSYSTLPPTLTEKLAKWLYWPLAAAAIAAALYFVFVIYATGQADPIVKALLVWSFLHQPELILQANYVNVDGDGIKRIRKSWEHFDSAESRAVNFTTLSKPDDTPLNKNFDSGEVYYQERKF